MALCLFSCVNLPQENSDHNKQKNNTIPESAPKPEKQDNTENYFKPEVDNFIKSRNISLLLKDIQDKMAREKRTADSLKNKELVILGNALLANNKIEDADVIFQTMLKNDEKDKQALEALINVSSILHKIPESGDYLERLKKLYPDDITTKILEANTLRDQQKNDEAETLYNEILKKNENEDALVNLAKIDLNKSKWDEAENLLNRALILDKNNAEIYSLLSYVEDGKELYLKAEKYLDQAASLEPDNQWILLDRVNLVWRHLSKAEKAKEDIKKILLQNPDSVICHVYLSEIYDVQNDPEKAYSEIQKVLLLKPDYKPIYPSATMLAFEMKDWDQAEKLSALAYKDYPGEFSFAFINALSKKNLGKADYQEILGAISKKYDNTTTIGEMARFINNPAEDFALTDMLSKEKSKVVKVRLQFYQACQYLYFKQINSAKAVLQDVSESTLQQVPEIRMAKTWIKGLAN